MQRSSGFTLIELLVVIAIVGALVALLLPAIQSARGAARRIHCANNLKQIGCALHAYHGSHGSFPPGNHSETVGTCPGDQVPGEDVPSEDRENWLIAILPYLERSPLHGAYQSDQWNEAAANQSVRETRIGTYLCPSDVDREKLTVPAVGPACGGAMNVAYAPGSYRGVSGRSDGFRFLDSGDFSSYPRSWRGALHTVGILGFEAEKVKDISDGLSTTLLVGESTTRTCPGYRTLWAYSYAFYSLSSITPQRRTLWGDYARCEAAGGQGYSFPCRRGWGSMHADGLHFLFCDSAVRFVSTSADMELLARLATIAGGEVAEFTSGEL